MKLINDPSWKAVHFKGRTILKSDKPLFPRIDWDYFVHELEVEPMKRPGHYRAVEEVAGEE